MTEGILDFGSKPTTPIDPSASSGGLFEIEDTPAQGSNAIFAVDSFGFMDIDFLAIGPYWVSKSENLERFPSMSHDDYLEIRRTRYNERRLGSYSEIDISKFDSAFLDVERHAEAFVRKHHIKDPKFASGSVASCTIR